MNMYKLLAAMLGLMFLAGCGDSGQQIPAGEETKYLFSLKSGEVIGDKVGGVSLDERGIHIHPGLTPTAVVFNLDGKIRALTYNPFIANLDAEGQKHPEAGVVGFEVLVDGKSVEKMTVDRTSKLEKTLELKDAKVLEFRVDEGNGTPAWDWFFVKVKSVK